MVASRSGLKPKAKHALTLLARAEASDTRERWSGLIAASSAYLVGGLQTLQGSYPS